MPEALHLCKGSRLNQCLQLRQGLDFPLDQSKNEQVRTQETFKFNFAVAAEPRLTILALGEPEITEALDDRNRSLLTQQESGLIPGMPGMPAGMARMHRMQMHRMMARMNPGGGMGMVDSAQILMTIPAKDARKLKLIRGTIPVDLEGKTETTLVTDDLSKALSKEIDVAGKTVQIHLLLGLTAVPPAIML
jgi:hypothetical protein